MTAMHALKNLITGAVQKTFKNCTVSEIVFNPNDDIDGIVYFYVYLTNKSDIQVKITKDGKLMYYMDSTRRWRKLKV